MGWKKIVTGITALMTAAGGLIATAPAASAAEACPADRLCLYRSTQFRELSFVAASTSACFDLEGYGMGRLSNGIVAYKNNLPVKATTYAWLNGKTPRLEEFWAQRYVINPGSSSSDTGMRYKGDRAWVCTGNLKPWE
ncbi:peptidase inhibitor family I36 protein (plasmid) [Streptomyces sp. BI20]|uniref:peptidase inhibitor family I36 protein n=1 Tax=Streptomyces sp. BI20 TaxID=3403460 RepID=UPI003C753CAC